VLSVEGELERIRERIELRAARETLARARAGRDVCWLEDPRDDHPLVTVRIATYNRPDSLVERALASALRQTYDHLEVLVVGDCTDEATDRALAAVRDPRVRYVNLPHPSLYPESRRERHAVSGSVPMTVGNLLARGAWIAPCDDDDELTDDHVEVLLRKAKSDRLELVHSNTSREVAPGVWETIGADPITAGEVTTGSVLFSAGLRFLPYSLTCWKLPEPHDWNLWRRMRDIGVRMGYLDRVTYRYFLPDHDDAMRGRPGLPPA
jgi:glycosyltransferase involved in cell wall biosynthesis